MSRSLLVVGAEQGSIGDAVAKEAIRQGRHAVVETAGITHEPMSLNVMFDDSIRQALEEFRPTDIVCTVGMNVPGSPGMSNSGFPNRFDQHMLVNAGGPVRLLHHWIKDLPYSSDVQRSFVAISSNSAHIPRSQSIAYCASKAALSMALRVAAREYAQVPTISIYGYEPGFVEGTPMSEDLDLGGRKPHRIPGDRALNAEALANIIVSNLNGRGYYFNGNMIRVDGGEL